MSERRHLLSQGVVPPLRPQAECAGARGYPENNRAQANENQRGEQKHQHQV
jgi:hypothetical protein